MSKIALFDLDGTMANYDKAMKRDLKKIMSPDETLPDDFHNLSEHWEERTRIIRRQPGWWRNLEVISAGRWVMMKALEIGYECHVLTKGPWSTSPAWTEKVEWCRANLPESVKVTITEKKSLVYGAVLMDDYPKYIESWLEHRPRGIVIMPDQPNNQGFKHPQVLRYYHNRPPGETNCHEVKQWLLQAFGRKHGQRVSHITNEPGVKIKTEPDSLICLEETCLFKQECANHASAGDFRTEGGFTPEISFDKEGSVLCATKQRKPEAHGSITAPENREKLGSGMLYKDKDGVLKAYSVYSFEELADIMDETEDGHE